MTSGASSSYTHTGFRYVLGFTPDEYAIWDRTDPGPPAERYPRTDEGWRRAWLRFHALEPEATPLGTGGASAALGTGPARSAPALVPTAALGRAVAVLLVLTIPANLLVGLARIPQIRLIDQALRGEDVLRADALAADARAGTAIALSLLLTLVAGVTWLVWQHRAQGNLHAARVPGLRFSPGWAVGWWFVPIANLAQVPRALRELWLASDAAPQEEWQRSRTPPLIILWWGSFLIPSLLTLWFSGPADDLEALRTFATAQMWYSFGLIPASVLAIALVRALTRRNTALVKRARAGRTRPAPGATSFTHSGIAHVLSTTPEGYAIWRRDAPAEPVERYPGTEEGWALAWARFSSLEPNAAPVSGS